MGYVGRGLNTGQYSKLDSIAGSFDGSVTTFSLEQNGTAVTPSAQNCLISLGGTDMTKIIFNILSKLAKSNPNITFLTNYKKIYNSYYDGKIQMLSNQFKNHSISRKYKAIVWGTPQNQKISGYIERNKINRKKMSLNQNKKGKFSETVIKLKKSFDICSIVECLLKTGRTHQVRLHMASINSSIIGDKLYGKNKMNKFEKNKESFNKFLILRNFNRQALHAYHIGFIHPVSNKYVEFESDIPEDMKQLLDLLLKY